MALKGSGEYFTARCKPVAPALGYLGHTLIVRQMHLVFHYIKQVRIELGTCEHAPLIVGGAFGRTHWWREPGISMLIEKLQHNRDRFMHRIKIGSVGRYMP